MRISALAVSLAATVATAACCGPKGDKGDKGEDAGGGDLVDAGQVGERSSGKTPEESIYEAAVLRFRPIMMTTTAALFGGGRWTDRVAGFDAVHDPRHLPLHGPLQRGHRAAPRREKRQTLAKAAGGNRQSQRRLTPAFGRFADSGRPPMSRHGGFPGHPWRCDREKLFCHRGLGFLQHKMIAA
jgi:hypothetical protein